ncbi:uncharacterized protein LOC127258632 isoform X2 [Andrographis paniculata]|uniref:uncharacterized protein LOC127258632 isoform X2 n=1 Tax=Andrographis paniculata TaxID=175694 RepID=UPI0021E7B7FB|nr:uncharacterized protein LOC127258632 isoform X2 [Andrographis paniculata]
MAGSKFRFLLQKLVLLPRAVSLYLAFLLGFFSSYIFRLGGDNGRSEKNDQRLKNFVEPDDGDDDEGENEEVCLKFKFPSYEEFRQIQKEGGNLFDEIDDDPGGNLEIDEGIEEEDAVDLDLDENQFSVENCDLESGSSNSYTNGFLSEIDFVEEMEISSDYKWDFTEEDSSQVDDINLDKGFLSEQDFDDNENVEYSDNIDDFEDDSEEEDAECEDSDSLWEHQELIEQLKMELKKVKATGLPTILEESETSPKILMEDLKPWKIDEFQRQDSFGDLHRFYKTYHERMRKFDIVSYQKMYAIGCLQLKDPLQSLSKEKSSPTFRSVLSQNPLHLFKNRVHGADDPMKKFVKELQEDLEAVYVAHTCLSWEFLQWQYEKALDLCDNDPRGVRTYNKVAGEFQQFQVLMHRFIEDEPFRGPRLQHYVTTRRAHRNLLQIPVIRQDNPKDRRKNWKSDNGEDAYIVTSETLVEILEESIRVFWRFVRADKDCIVSGDKKLPELAFPEDLKLLMEAKKALQKKQRKLREVVKSEKCILRKMSRCRGDDEYDHVLWFFSQVDMRLVGRTLNMSKITRDQLQWCHNKLDRISFVDRRLYVEPAFLLFPC